MQIDRATCDICQERFDSMEKLLEHQHRVHSADVAPRRPATADAVKEQEENTAA